MSSRAYEVVVKISRAREPVRGSPRPFLPADGTTMARPAPHLQAASAHTAHVHPIGLAPCPALPRNVLV